MLEEAMKLALVLCLSLMMIGVALSRTFDEPHLFYSPSGKLRLELTQVLPKKFQLCAKGKKFQFCSPWVTPKSRTVEVDLEIPLDTPNGEYHVFYEDGKHEVDLKHQFNVGK
jgi:hypothetical protein